jgi:hypothetical protein
MRFGRLPDVQCTVPLAAHGSYSRRCRPEQAISRILFPPPVSRQRVAIIHLGHPLPNTSCDLPGSSGGQPSNAPLFGLAPGGVYRASPVTRGTGALLPHRFTLTAPLLPDGITDTAVYFLLHFPSRHRDSALRSTLPCGVRTFLREIIPAIACPTPTGGRTKSLLAAGSDGSS